MFIVIGGATATGKSELAINLAKDLKGEIISADSMQIYRGMNIGTAKISRQEMEGIPHYMVDVVDPWESFSLADYMNKATQCIKEINARGKLAIVCGGTGLYINSLIYDYNLSSYDETLRQELMKELNDKGIDYMYEKLLSLDPLANSIHKNNVKRVIRALEAIIGDGKSILDKNDKINIKPHLFYAVDIERETLYDRIDRRVDKMFEYGLEEEVENLIKEFKLSFDMQSMQAIGYREFSEYFDSRIDIVQLKNNIKQHSRNYAKRQYTWFKHSKSCKWLKNGDKINFIDIIKHDYYKYKDNL